MEYLPARANAGSVLILSDASKFPHTDTILHTLTASFFLHLSYQSISKGS